MAKTKFMGLCHKQMQAHDMFKRTHRVWVVQTSGKCVDPWHLAYKPRGNEIHCHISIEAIEDLDIWTKWVTYSLTPTKFNSLSLR